MTLQVLLWALGTGFVTGAVWFAILFFRRHQTASSRAPILPASHPTDANRLEDVTRRLSELEERVDANEYLLKREKVAQPRRPPS
jgi:hypothetical protein